MIDAGRRIKPDLHRNGVIFLHLLGGQARGLGGDFQNDRRRVGIGFDVQPRKCDEPGRAEHHKTQDDDRAARQTELK